MTYPNILHISDLHFREDDPEADQRNIVLRGALDTIRTLADAGRPRPGIVCVTGDIAWGGTRQDYDLANEWFEEVRSALDLSFEDFVLCPGNHDIDRRFAVDLERPDDVNSADRIFKRLLADSDESFCLDNTGDPTPPRIRPFREFVRFCHRLGIPSLSQGARQGYLWGIRTHKGARLIILNSAWFCKDDHDDRKLHVGLPLLERLISQCGLGDLKSNVVNPLTIALVHHPRHWLAEKCRSPFPPRPAEWSILSQSVHVILHGHTHEPRGPMLRVPGEAIVVPAGSVDGGIRFPNRIHLLNVEESGQLNRMSWTLDSADSTYAWRQDPDDIPVVLPGWWQPAARVPAFDKAKALSVMREEVLTFIRRKQDALPHRRGLPLPKARLVTEPVDDRPLI